MPRWVHLLNLAGRANKFWKINGFKTILSYSSMFNRKTILSASISGNINYYGSGFRPPDITGHEVFGCKNVSQCIQLCLHYAIMH